MPGLIQNRTDHEPTSLNTMVFADLVSQRPTDRALRILDLGTVRQSTIDFFSDYHCHILVTGLCDDYVPGEGLGKQTLKQCQQLIKQDISRHSNNHYDLILFWDLLNYLDKDHVPLLVAPLLPVLTSATRCHSFLYTTANRPSRPGGFEIVSREQMILVPGTTEQNHSKSITQTTLGKFLPHYKTLRTVLMRNGTQELAFEVQN
ncbi:MAG TPA: hypothetical protein ENI64_04625 [Gammaproteobacteria bacterium]|nr:hypothetical protein [Gammaproteobacteria bacterium]